MASEMSRREVMKTGLAAAALGAAANFEWVLPALAQGEVMVPFTDSHVNPPFNANPAPDRRLFDTRSLSGAYTPKDQFFTTQHYGHPEIDPAAFRLKVGGLVNTPLALALDWKVAVLQFVKSGDWKVGEEKIGRRLGVDWRSFGDGFTWDSDNLEQDKSHARAGWAEAKA